MDMKQRIKITVINGLVSMVVVMLFSILYGIMATTTHPSEFMKYTMIVLSLLVSGGLAGYVNAIMCKDRGLVMGMCAGLVISMVLIMGGVFVDSSDFAVIDGIKLLLPIVSGGIMGVVAVNKGGKKFKI